MVDFSDLFNTMTATSKGLHECRSRGGVSLGGIGRG